MEALMMKEAPSQILKLEILSELKLLPSQFSFGKLSYTHNAYN